MSVYGQPWPRKGYWGRLFLCPQTDGGIGPHVLSDRRRFFASFTAVSSSIPVLTNISASVSAATASSANGLHLRPCRIPRRFFSFSSSVSRQYTRNCILRAYRLNVYGRTCRNLLSSKNVGRRRIATSGRQVCRFFCTPMLKFLSIVSGKIRRSPLPYGYMVACLWLIGKHTRKESSLRAITSCIRVAP